jgi:hypothetical protein
MLPSYFFLRIDVVDSTEIGADVTKADGASAGIDVNYPGFYECLGRLIEGGYVIHAFDEYEGTRKKGRMVRHFINPTTQQETKTS